MGGAGIDGLGAGIHQGLCRVAQGTGGVHHVVVEDAGLAPDVADDVHDLANVGLLAALIHDGKAHVDLAGEGAGPAHGADIGGDHHEIVVVKLLLGELVHIVLDEGGAAQQMVQRDVEEALDLGGVEVHGQDPVGAGGGEHIGHQLGGDGVTGLGLAVLAGVAEIGDNGGDTAGGSAAAGVDEDQQLHEPVVDGLAGGGDQVDVAAADGLVDGHGHLAVGEGLQGAAADGQAQLGAQGLGKFLAGVAVEDLDIGTVG